MSIQAISDFRSRINQDPELAKKAGIALGSGLPEVVALGSEYGYHFTEAEARTALDEFAKDGELSDHESEVVSAGGVGDS